MKSFETEHPMLPALQETIASVKKEMAGIPEERKQSLQLIARFIEKQYAQNLPANLVFICTHNSRRSHLSQIWAATAAVSCGLSDHVHTFSGGTEATAFNPRAVAAMQRAGFMIENPGGDNPQYKLKYSEKGPEWICFSKTYDHPYNPQENFAAVMTCSEADQNCPFVPGASARISLPYSDPKEADGSPEEASVYDERCRQIAAEMFYAFSQVKLNKGKSSMR